MLDELELALFEQRADALALNERLRAVLGHRH
jgi:hypothetical protein